MDNNFDLIRSEVKVQVRRAIRTKSIEPLVGKYKSFQETDRDLKPSFDQAFRDVQLEYITNEVNVGLLEELITLSIEACRREMLTYSTPVTLLGDIFDLLTLDDCKKMFVYVEKHVNIWKEDLFFSNCKNILLRICNDLLKRLSKSNSTIFCGRILLFLAKFFPFSERSGLNIVSEFNLDNITEYSADGTEVEEVVQKGKFAIDYSLYCKFWSLQDFFRYPSQCYDKAHWKVFCTNSASIISTFEGLKLEHLEKDPAESEDEDEKAEEAEVNNYFSKYLTNQKLLDLQLYDVNFRRFVLLQFLILFQYLTSTVRFKTGQELQAEQKQYVESMSEKVHTLLRETPPDGVEFEAIVNKILAREEFWNAWKNDGCQEFRRTLPAAPSDSDAPMAAAATEPRVPLGELIKESAARGTYHMGNVELTKLWNLNPNNLDACQTKERDFLPTLEDFFGDALTAASESRAFMDEGFCWRGLRLLARRSTHFYTSTNTPITQLHQFLHKTVSKLQQSAREGCSDDVLAASTSSLDLQQDEPADPDEELKVQNILLFRVTVLTVKQFHNICKALQDDWQMLACKLHFPAGDIAYIVSHNSEPLQQARNLLNLWFEEDDDSTLENFLYILEGLGLAEAADVVKHAIEQNKNLTTDTSNSNEND